MDPQEIKEIIKEELPTILKDDPEMREFVLRLTEGRYADRVLTDSRFDRVLEELKSEREARVEDSKRQAAERAEERRQQAALTYPSEIEPELLP